MRMILVTVGTSLLTNQGWRPGDALPGEPELLHALRDADPRRASAEVHTLHLMGLQSQDLMRWLHSDTEEGRRCASVLCQFYERAGYRGCLEVIAGMNYQATRFAEQGLKSLLDVTFRLIREARAQGREPVICATGGFKAETAFMNLVGLLMQIEVYYLHERFQGPVRLPRLPVEWDTQLVAQHAAFFAWIDGELRTRAEAESWLRACPALRDLVYEEEGYVLLSAAGELLYRAYQERHGVPAPAAWPPNSLRNPADKNRVSSEEHHRPPGWREFVDFLIRQAWVEEVRYDGTGPRGPGQTRIYREGPEVPVIGVVYCRDDRALPLCVTTTARDAAERAVVLEWLRRELRRW
ncbi:MAG: putative CRISPR-associated protein [Chloroherpetonaceae bacterium]|nr:putative CRISPR-associated protein [Chthonomonadaceae bacterium]MDW8209289.1 putative CRISPR-associated protein [Chloroherpetonaceae bacterium]